MITAAVAFAWCAGPAGIVLLGIPLLIVAAVAWGVRRLFAAFGMVDLVVAPPLLLLFGFAVDSLVWRLPTYLVSVSSALVMLTGHGLPDWFLPVKGPWARKLWATLTILGLLAVLGAESLFQPEAWRQLGWGLFAFAAFLWVYLWPLWDVMVRGWSPPEKEERERG